MNRQFDAREIRAALRPSTVLSAQHIPFTCRGRQLRFADCPACGQRTRNDAVTANDASGVWHCHRCAAGGDVLSMLAGYHRLDVVRNFRDVLRLGAELAGLAGLTEGERREHAMQASQQQRERQARDRARQAARDVEGRSIAGHVWASLAPSSAIGEAYVVQRGLSSLHDCADILRYSKPGWPSVPQFDPLGRLCNVVTRRFPESLATPRHVASELQWPHVVRSDDAPKIRGLKGCTTQGTLVGKLADIQPGKRVCVAEGMFDTLTAIVAWSDAVVLGANGAGNFANVVSAAAARMRDHQSQLVLVVDGDATGERAALEAIDSARKAGISGRRIEIAELGNHHDLNSAWQAGWRP